MHSIVLHEYIPLKKQYDNRGGLSERILKQRLEQQGWIVWKSALIGFWESADPNVERKNAKLHELLDPETREWLEYMNAVHHGLPDYICYRAGKWKFVECKLGHEQLNKNQRKCIPKLKGRGFHVEVHKLVEDCTKTRAALVQLGTREKKILEKQMVIRVQRGAAA